MMVIPASTRMISNIMKNSIGSEGNNENGLRVDLIETDRTDMEGRIGDRIIGGIAAAMNKDM